MSEHLAGGPPAAEAPHPAGNNRPAQEQPAFPIHHSWKVATVVAIVMVLLALLGVGLTTTSSAVAPTYWICLVPVFALLCIATAMSRKGQTNTALFRHEVVQQLLHWLGIAVALGLDFYIRGTGEETGIAAGLNALLLLALGCYLAGIHLEWPFVLVGVILSLLLLVVTKADQYLWLVFVIVGLGIVVILGIWRLATARQARKDKAAAAAAAPAVPAGS